MLVLLAGRNAGDAAEGVGAEGSCAARPPVQHSVPFAKTVAWGEGGEGATAPVASTATTSAAANFCDELLYSMRVVQFPCD